MENPASQPPDPAITAGAFALARWMAENGVTRGDVADAVGVSKGAINGWRSGEYRPDALVRLKLQVYTGGAVSIESWLTDAERAEVVRVVPFRPVLVVGPA